MGEPVTSVDFHLDVRPVPPDLAALSEGDLARPSWTPVGPATYGSFMAVRVFDFWVHERDITRPLGLATDDGDARAAMALGEVERSLGYIVGKKIGLPYGSSIVFHLTGPLRRELYVAVDGRATVVGHIDRPDVELSTDSITFVQLACGRIDPQAQIDAGLVPGRAMPSSAAARPRISATPCEHRRDWIRFVQAGVRDGEDDKREEGCDDFGIPGPGGR